VKRPAFWILLSVVSLAAAAAAIYYFPRAFSIVALDIKMNREQALRDARAIAYRDQLGPADFREAASFALDDATQTFVELEGGGKEAFTQMLRDRLYLAYTWKVRHFKEGNAHETLIQFAPDGQPYGFVEKLSQDAAGPALAAPAARQRAETDAKAGWAIDLSTFTLVEQGQERKPSGRVDHTFTYERALPTLNEGRYRLRLVVAGDRLTEVTHFVKVPEAFTRRYANMRAANEAIGLYSAVGMLLLYVVGGIAVGLFYMLRHRYVLWRQAAIWGLVVGGLQAAATINDWPLMWMTYDTAVSRSNFLAQQIAAIVATLIGFSAFMALSFMAAETLTRRAFGHHPQFWSVWSKEGGSSTAVLGRTVGGFLLVTLFFAYDVVLYLVATQTFGWWTPAEALLHPDVLASYVPWLSAIANSLQAGFWEEALFRAVPIAGAALIGDRFGQRRLFIVIAFVIQVIIFGAGHAPYPTQPSYARPVELILPSIGFGLLYLYWGLLPGIVLHFAFDVVWFALPIFLADAPGIWIQQTMVIVMTLVPLWVVLWRRVQVGRWTQLSPTLLNDAWTPPPPPVEYEVPAPTVLAPGLSPRAMKIWMAIGAASAIVCGAALLGERDAIPLNVTRTQAESIARRALDERGVTLGPGWKVLPVPDDGSGGAHEFVAATAGNDRRKALLGVYLPEPRWIVRVITFEGDVAERAEEWHVLVNRAGQVARIEHVLPEGRPGPSLDERAARTLANAAIARQFGLDVSKGQAREVSARPAKLAARTDWTLTFVDASLSPLPQGELRMDVVIAGDEISKVTRYVFVPEQWERRTRAAETRNLIIRICVGVIFGGLLVAAAVSGIVAWSRRRYAARLFAVTSLLMFLAALLNTANNWPNTVAQMQTALPFGLQVGAVIGSGIVALIVAASLAGLAMGALPRRLTVSGVLPDRDALLMGVAGGFFGAALTVLAAWLRTPAWAQTSDVSSLGTYLPLIDLPIDPLTGLLNRIAVVATFLAGVSLVTHGWTERRVLGTIMILVVGFLGAGAPAGSFVTGWAAAGALLAMGLVVAYVFLLRADLTIVPIALGTMVAFSALARGAQRVFPGALAGSVIAVIVIAATTWWAFRALRAYRPTT
jgi:membrane protease YdiL (CAAX protease family)